MSELAWGIYLIALALGSLSLCVGLMATRDVVGVLTAFIVLAFWPITLPIYLFMLSRPGSTHQIGVAKNPQRRAW